MRDLKISRCSQTTESVRNRLPDPAGLAQRPAHPVTDGIDVNWRPRKPGRKCWGHAHRAGHELGHADHLDRALVAHGHMCAHRLVSLGRRACRERGGDDGAERDAVAQAEIHALAAGRGVNVSGVADEADAGARRSVFAARAREELLRDGAARAEARRPDHVTDAHRVRVLALVAGERVRAELLEHALAILDRWV